VPLLVAQRRRATPMPMPLGGATPGMESIPAAPAAQGKSAAASEASDMEQAVIGHGPNLGRFREGYGRKLIRDTRFPIRVTVQFYKATSNGVVSDADLDAIASNIGQVYEHADAVGSLVLPEGDRLRPTAWTKISPTWFRW
jgi:hypothetical protein